MAEALIDQFSGFVRSLEEKIRREVEAELVAKYHMNMVNHDDATRTHNQERTERGRSRDRAHDDSDGGSDDGDGDGGGKKRKVGPLGTNWPEIMHRYHLKPPGDSTLLFWEELEALLVYLYSGVNITHQFKEKECRLEASRAAQLICFTEIDSTEGKIRRISKAHRDIRAKHVENALHSLLGRFCPRIILDPNEELVCTFETPLSELEINISEDMTFQDDLTANYTHTIINIQEVLKEDKVRFQDWSRLLWKCIPETLGRKFIELDEDNIKPWPDAILEIVKRWGTSRMEAEQVVK